MHAGQDGKGRRPVDVMLMSRAETTTESDGERRGIARQARHVKRAVGPGPGTRARKKAAAH